MPVKDQKKKPEMTAQEAIDAITAYLVGNGFEVPDTLDGFVVMLKERIDMSGSLFVCPWCGESVESEMESAIGCDDFGEIECGACGAEIDFENRNSYYLSLSKPGLNSHKKEA